MKYISYIALGLCLPLAGCGPLDLALADAELPAEVKESNPAPAVSPSPLDLLEAELNGLEDSLPTLEIAAPVLDGPAEQDEPPVDDDTTALIDPTNEAVSRWLMDPSLLDDPDAKHFMTVAREIAAIRQDIERLRQTMDAQMGGYYDDLQRENAELRRELRHAYTVRGGGQGMPMLPLDQSAEGLWADTAPVGTVWDAPADIDGADPEMAPLVANDPGITAIVGSSDAQYAIIAEWGRSPEQVEALGTDASSLRGMVAVVPPDTSEEAIVQLGRELHAEHANYDNVNIQIFNDSTAAETYSKTNSMADGVPILRISKYRNSGEDKVYLSRDGVEVDVTPQP